MAVMSAADYFVYTDIFTDDDITGFINQDSINVIKKTKKSEKEVDIKPLIYSIKKEDNGIFIKLAQGSAQNLKPELVVTALENFKKVIPHIFMSVLICIALRMASSFP